MCVGTLLAGLVLATAAAAARPSLALTPSSVVRGHVVEITGSADGCPVGDMVFVISRAFSHRNGFAGVPAVLARVAVGGRFHATTRIQAAKRPGRYTVTARCGGANLGVLRYLTVRR